MNQEKDVDAFATLEAFERSARRHKDMWMRFTPVGLHLLHSTPTSSKHLTRIIPWEELKQSRMGFEELINMHMDDMAKQLKGEK